MTMITDDDDPGPGRVAMLNALARQRDTSLVQSCHHDDRLAEAGMIDSPRPADSLAG